MRPVQGKTKILKSGIHGYGVFAVKDIRSGEIIEQMPALAIRHIDLSSHGLKNPHSPINTHAYEHPGLREIWIGTGTSSFYNSSATPNANFGTVFDEIAWIMVWAMRGIREGEEITLDYLQEQ